MHCLFHSSTWEIQSAHPTPIPKCHSSAEEPANSLQKMWQDVTANIYSPGIKTSLREKVLEAGHWQYDMITTRNWVSTSLTSTTIDTTRKRSPIPGNILKSPCLMLYCRPQEEGGIQRWGFCHHCPSHHSNGPTPPFRFVKDTRRLPKYVLPRSSELHHPLSTMSQKHGSQHKPSPLAPSI